MSDVMSGGAGGAPNAFAQLLHQIMQLQTGGGSTTMGVNPGGPGGSQGPAGGSQPMAGRSKGDARDVGTNTGSGPNTTMSGNPNNKMAVPPPAPITPGALTDAAVNFQQPTAITPAQPIQGGQPANGLQTIMQLLGIQSQGGIQNSPVQAAANQGNTNMMNLVSPTGQNLAVSAPQQAPGNKAAAGLQNIMKMLPQLASLF